MEEGDEIIIWEGSCVAGLRVLEDALRERARECLHRATSVSALNPRLSRIKCRRRHASNIDLRPCASARLSRLKICIATVTLLFRVQHRIAKASDGSGG
eukprot:880342-Rhodomonas_salina.3